MLIIFLAIFEFILSLLIALKIDSEKNIVSDIVAAMIMVVIGGVYETAGYHILMPCQKLRDTGVANPKDCIEFGQTVMSFGETLRTTMGMNSVVAAIVFYAVIKLIVLFLIPKIFNKT
mgnify:FL=1|jgi:hypothetical protein